MSRHQVRLLLCSAASVALIVGATFVLEWFKIDFGPSRISIGLREASMCIPDEGCRSLSLSHMGGFFPLIAAVAFWGAMALALLVVTQLLMKMITGVASPVMGKLGYGLGGVVFLSAFGAGYLFAPETDGMFEMMGISVTRTFAAPLLLAGSLIASLAVRYALIDDALDGEYKPVVVRKHRAGDARLPVTPINVKPVSTTGRVPTPPSQRDRIPSPSGTERVPLSGREAAPGPGPRERVPTPGSFERIPLPGREGATGPAPGPRDRKLTPGSFERIPLPGREGATGPVPGPRDRKPTPGSFERIPLPGREGDRVATPPARVRLPDSIPFDVELPEMDLSIDDDLPGERTKSAPQPGQRVRASSEGSGTSVSAPRTASDQPAVARTTSPGGRTRNPSDQPLVARTTSPGGRASDRESPELAARTTSPGGRARTASDRASLDEPAARTASPGGRARSASDRGSADEPLVARTASPGGRARTASGERTSDEPFVARTASPGGRARTASGDRSDEPLVARTTSPGGRARTASGDRTSDEPLVARTTSPSGRARTASEPPPGSGTSVSAPRARGSSDHPLESRTRSPSHPHEARTRSPLQPNDARARSPSQPFERVPDDEFTSEAGSQRDLLRAHSSSSGPIDLAARLSGAPIAVAIKPPLPEPVPVPPDQIPVAPESGLVIRKRTPSAGPLSSQRIPPASSQPLPLASSQQLPLTSSQQPPLASSQQLPLASSQPLPLASSQPLPLASSQQLPLTSSQQLPLTSSQQLPLASSQQLPLSSQLPLAQSSSQLPRGGTGQSSQPIPLPPPGQSQPIATSPPAPSPSQPIPLPPPAQSASQQIPVGPESGLSIRNKSPSSAPPGTTPAPVAIKPRSSATGRTPAAAMPSVALRSLSDDLGDLDLALPQASAPALTMPPVDDVMADLYIDIDNPSETTGPAPAESGPPAPSTLPNATMKSAVPAESRTPAPTPPPSATIRTPAPATLVNPTPVPLRGKLRYAVIGAKLTSAGVDAVREDGTTKLVEWEAIVGIIARRLPNEAPFDGVTFVDLVSTSGATLRILPWTQITGAPLFDEGEERARTFVQLVAAHCLDAKLDTWTKVFADGSGHAAQLPNAKTLAAHDERLA